MEINEAQKFLGRRGQFYPVVFIGLAWFTYGHCVSLMGSMLDTVGREVQI